MDFSSYGASRDDWFRNLKRHKYENANNENFFLSIDDALDFTGDNSRYQKFTNYIFSFQYAIYSFLLMGFPLLLAKPSFICSNGRTCKEKEACSQGGFRTIPPDNNLSITVEFKLYCDNSEYNGLLGALLFVGSFLAFLFFPYIGNWKGRKFGMVLAIALSGLSSLCVGMSDLFIAEEYREYVIYLLMVILVLCGFAFSGFETLCYAYTSEVSGERFRNISSVTMGTVWSVAQIVVANLFEYSGDWRYVFIFIMATPWLISLLFLMRYVYETPRFLNAKKRYVEARDVINKICIMNRRPDFKARLYGEMEFENSKVVTLAPRTRITEQNKPKEENSGYIALFRQPQLRTTTLILLWVWFFRNFTYFGLNYSLPILGMELYQNFKIAAIAETIAVLLAGKVKFMMERIRSLCYSIILVSVCCLFSVFFPIPKDCYEENQFCYQKTLSVIFAVIAKFSIALFANILVTYTSESYSTEFRSLGLGLTMTASQFGTVAMPFIITRMNEEDINPLILFGGMGIFSLILIIWCLPETKNKLFRHFLLEPKGKDETILEMKSMGEPLLSKQNTIL